MLPSGCIIANAILLIQLIRIRFNHVYKVGDGFLLFDRYRFEMFHDCLKLKKKIVYVYNF